MMRSKVFNVFLLYLIIFISVFLHYDCAGSTSYGYPSEDKVTVRDILYTNTSEAYGYGLYSYILFPKKPDENTRPLYLEVTKAYLRLNRSADMSEYENIKNLNITYFLLDLDLRDISQYDIPKIRQGLQNPEWILNHYDYARAQSLLRKIPEKHNAGPYIFSSLTPLTSLTRGTVKNSYYLYHDLTGVPLRLVGLWVGAFEEQAAQQEFWNSLTLTNFIKVLRKHMAHVGAGIGDIYKTFEYWKKSIKGNDKKKNTFLIPEFFPLS